MQTESIIENYSRFIDEFLKFKKEIWVFLLKSQKIKQFIKKSLSKKFTEIEEETKRYWLTNICIKYAKMGSDLCLAPEEFWSDFEFQLEREKPIFFNIRNKAKNLLERF